MFILTVGLTKRSVDVLLELPLLEGLTAYQVSRRLSRKLNLASSTTKFALKRLQEAGLITNGGQVELTNAGRALCEELTAQGMKLSVAVPPWSPQAPLFLF